MLLAANWPSVVYSYVMEEYKDLGEASDEFVEKFLSWYS
jgi:hypothetical protein